MAHNSAAAPHPQRGTIAAILCAGQGTRMGAGRNKVFLPLAGKPLLVHTIAAFTQARVVDDIVLVAHPLEMDYIRDEIVERYKFPRVTAIIAGGETRHQSEDNVLTHLRERINAGELDVILIHDGARPLIAPAAIDAVVEAARTHGSALLASPVGARESLARVAEDGMIQQVIEPADLWRAQTPQAFDARMLLAVYDQARHAGFEGTDTAASFERAGHAVAVVAGSAANIKVTTPADLLAAELRFS
ncbi:MAG: 2-C-methyl-D-erythritol 4-phosphate cytidylyltransferase [Ktedonobacterales bacterium]|nr:MAG: 2-C-methyl-D-erythritol 4-phosphate cytidylyltransferase [Ktedonobacterales bacterium]